jgi:hypothetical protein
MTTTRSDLTSCTVIDCSEVGDRPLLYQAQKDGIVLNVLIQAEPYNLLRCGMPFFPSCSWYDVQQIPTYKQPAALFHSLEE